MTSRLVLLTTVALLVGCEDAASTGSATTPAAAVVAAAPPAGTDWVSTVSETADGGFRMGNPNAPIRLVEYASLTCSHCGEFSKEGVEALKARYIPTGKVSYELRNYVRDPIDMMASLLARCSGAGPYHALSEAMYADQTNWLNKVQTLGQAGFQRIQALPPAQQFAELARVTGLEAFARARGVSVQRQAQCFADKAAVDKLVAVRDRANSQFQLQGTPTFLLNDQVVPETASWAQLEPKLKAAGA